MQNSKIIFVITFLLITIGAIYFLYTKYVQAPAQVACTMEAKICPDGSSVGRTGPQCEFAACPSATTTQPSDETIVLALGESRLIDGKSIKPFKILEDSRCPEDVQCIAAGSVKVDVGINPNPESVTFELNGDPIFISPGVYAQLSQVTPNKISTQKIKDADYRFSFVIQKSSQKIIYKNATPEMIHIDIPTLNATVSHEITVSGKASGNWFFECSFPIELQDKKGDVLVSTPGTTKEDCLTANLIPFSAKINVPETFIGDAVLVLRRDNPSGLPQYDASISFPIIIK